jgi:hypothetical protein
MAGAASRQVQCDRSAAAKPTEHPLAATQTHFGLDSSLFEFGLLGLQAGMWHAHWPVPPETAITRRSLPPSMNYFWPSTSPSRLSYTLFYFCTATRIHLVRPLLHILENSRHPNWIAD